MGGAHVGQPGTQETLRSHLSVLRATDVVQGAAKLSLLIERVGGNPYGAAQGELVDELFPAEVANRLRAGLEAGGGNGGFDVLFFPGQLMALQKLALALAIPGPPTSFDDGSSVGHFVTAAAQVNDVRDQLMGVPADDMDELDLAANGFRAGELNRIRFPPAIGGRAYRLWLQPTLAWPSGLEHPDAFCEREFGVSLKRFVAIAAAPAITRVSVDPTDPSDVPFQVEHYFSTTRIDPAEARRVLDRLTYRAAVGPAALGDSSTYWSLLDLADRPYLPCGDDIVVPCSLRYALERATTGIFWMLRAANAGQVGELTSHFGQMFEAYCVTAAKGLVATGVTVSGDIEYGPPGRRKRSPDILITALSTVAPVRIFVECRAGRPPSAVFTTGDLKAFDSYLDDLKGKLGQLDRGIQDHLSGEFTIPGDLAGHDDAYIPVLVVDEPFQWTFTLKLVLDRIIRERGWFRDSRVSAPIIMGVDDFDALVGSCERGDDIGDVLRAYLLSDRMDPIDVTLYDRSGLLKPSAYCAAGWDAYFEGVRATLF